MSDERHADLTPMGPDLAPPEVSKVFDRAFTTLHDELPASYDVFLMVYDDHGITAATSDELTERIHHFFQQFLMMQRMSKQ